MQAWDKFFEIKHAQPEDTQDLLIKLVEDVRSISEEFAEFINIPTWNLSPSSYDDDDDEESSIPLKDIIMSELPPDDESSYEEDVHEMSFKTYSNPLFDLDKEIISIELNPIHNEDLDSTPKDVRFDAESYLLESLVNRDTLNVSPPKIDHLFDEFADELTRYQLIPPGIDIINLDPEGDILDSDSSREEIDIFFGPEDSIPPGIESDDFDSEDDNNSTFLRGPKSFHLIIPTREIQPIICGRHPHDVLNLFLTPIPPFHLDFDFIPSHNNLGSNLMNSSPSGDRNKTYDPGICIKVESMKSLAAHSSVIDTSLPFSSENEVKVFNHDDLSTLSPSLKERTTLGSSRSPNFPQGSINPCDGSSIATLNKRFVGGTPCLSVVDCPDCEDSQFCHSSRVSHPQLHLGIRYPNLID
ncbi:hypothetical protein Tco_1006613 [Tanacetum coccineum]|uniref:C2H2-type domain-containing protein n=1 Tax=Tanacetum coccineum TaxID=301880 RepID=A0ABQ5FI75_9ASTR